MYSECFLFCSSDSPSYSVDEKNAAPRIWYKLDDIIGGGLSPNLPIHIAVIVVCVPCFACVGVFVCLCVCSCICLCPSTNATTRFDQLKVMNRRLVPAKMRRVYRGEVEPRNTRVHYDMHQKGLSTSKFVNVRLTNGRLSAPLRRIEFTKPIGKVTAWNYTFLVIWWLKMRKESFSGDCFYRALLCCTSRDISVIYLHFGVVIPNTRFSRTRGKKHA